MSRLAESGVTVVYVDSPGHRRPSASSDDARRMARRLAAWRPGPRQILTSLWRDSPLLVPIHTSTVINRVNRLLLRRRLRTVTRRAELHRPVLWAYSPIAAQLYEPSRHAALVYHCVDDVAAFPGVDRTAFELAERDLIGRSTVCIGSSKPLCARLLRLGAKRVLYWPNPADVSSIQNSLRDAIDPPERPTVGFIGAVQEDKIDIPLVKDLAARVAPLRVQLAGPVGLGLGHSEITRDSFPDNVDLLGLVPREQIADFLKGLSVGIIPYRLTDYTAGVYPMKVHEYLAAGLPVISTPLPSLVGEVGGVVYASTAAEFADAIEDAIASDSLARRRDRMAAARSHSWETRVAEARELLHEFYD